MLRPWTQAARSLARRPLFAVSSVVILGAGIAATTGVFSVVDASVLRPLPYPQPDRLVSVLEANSSKREAAGLLAPARLEDWNKLNSTFDAIAGSYAENVTESGGDTPERLASRRVSPRYFSVFGVRPLIGRAFLPEEEASGGPASAVISDHVWMRRFQRRSDVLRQRFTLGGRSYAIVGVMPADFDDARIDLWIPAQTSPMLMQVRNARFYTGVGRMKRGVTIAAAQRDLARVQAELGRLYPTTDKAWSAQVTDLKASRIGAYRDPLVFILGSVALLLLIALANTAALMLTQLQRRQHELAIRSVLGATRAQVALSVVQEVLILAAIAAILAIAVDAAVLRVASTKLASLPRAAHVSVDWRALAVASVCGACAALACGAIPAWRATRRDFGAALSRAGRGISHDGRSQRLLVGAQIAVATVLLASTGLMLRSYYNLSHVDAGFDPSHAVTFHVGAAWDEDRVNVGRMQRELVAAFANMPGVSAVGFSNFLPVSNATIRYQVRLQDAARDTHAAEQELANVGERSVTSGYFQALGARMSAGTSCPALPSVRTEPPKAIVNRRFAETYANGRNVVGRYVSWGPGQPGGGAMEVVGVVDDIREDNLRTAAVPYLYVCLAPGDWPDPEYVVRTASDPSALLAAVRSVVRRVDPSRAVFGLSTLEDYVGGTLGQARLQTTLIATFGAAAALLAAVGLFGLATLVVMARRREIGIRLALGAEPARVVREFAMSIAWLVAAGAVAGLAMTAVAQRELRAVVYGVAPLDPATLAAVVVGLGVAASVATLVPAWRASSIDPAGVLRES